MRRALLVALLCALGAAAGAQDEPTPFWIAPPARAPKKKPVEVQRRKAPPKQERRAKPQRAERAQRPVAPVEPGPVEPASSEPSAQEPTVRTPAEPAMPEPAPRESSVSRAPELSSEPAAPSEPPAAVAREPASPRGEPASPSGTPLSSFGGPDAPLDEPPRVQRASETPRGAAPKWSLGAVLGAWAKMRSDGTGRDLQLAYGLRAARTFLDGRLEADFRAIRAGGSAGSPYVSASATHNLLSLRAAWVYGPQRWALLGGLGLGAMLTQTHDSLRDVSVGGKPTGLDANSAKPTLEAFVAARVRILGGLEGRVEVDGVLRDGRTEWMPLGSLGAAF